MMSANQPATASGRIALLLLLLGVVAPCLGIAQITINPEAKLYAPTPASPDGHAGEAVSISGTTAAVGASNTSSGKGAVYIFVRNINTSVWTLQQTLTATDGVAGDNFGAAVSLSGDNVAIGAPNHNASAGAVYTFKRSGTTWTPSTMLTATGGAAGDQLGFSVAIEGLTIVAGAPHSSVSTRTDAGTAYVFTSLNGGATWQQQFHIQVTTGQARGGDHIGWSVALSQGTVLAGAPDDDVGGKLSVGSAYVFVRNGTAWSLQTKLNPGGSFANVRFGDAVSLVSNTAIIGADGKTSAQGAAYIYTRSGTTWTQQTILTATDGAAGDHFGAAVSVSGTQAAVGAPKANAPGAGSGKAYVFSYNGAWSELAFLKAVDNTAGDNFGTSISLDSGRDLVGSPFNASNAITGNGAAYSFVSQSASATTITNITPEPSVLSQSYTVSVQVASSPAGNGTPTGTVTVGDGVGATCPITLDANGLGSCSLATASAGTQTISANYSGDAIFGGSGATASHTVNGATTTTTITAETPDPSVVGQAINVSVSVTSASAGTITGPVTVSDGGANCTINDISLGNSCQLTILSAGVSSITAIYGGDQNFNSSTSTAVSHTTNKADTTTTIQSETPDPSTVGQAVTVTVAVAPVAPGSGTPAGSVTVGNGTDQCTIANIAISNSCQITFTVAGSSNLIATYAGNANYNGSASSGTAHTATPATTTTAIVSEAPDPSFAGQSVQVTVSVTPSTSGTPTGTVTVTDGFVSCNITLPSASNSCLMVFNAVGTTALVATYSGDAGFAGSASTPVLHTVNAPTALHLAFGVQPPARVLRGTKFNGVTVQVRDISNAVVTSDNSTQITLAVPACSGTTLALIGPVTVVNGIATFTNLPPHFYTLATGLQAGAQSNPAYTPDTSTAFDVVANSDLLFASGFESCRL